MLRLVSALLFAMPLAALDPVWLQSFDQVWQLVQDKHWDPAELERSGWSRLKAEYRPKVEAAQSVTEARGYMREMIQRLKLSHFHISGGDSAEEAVNYGDGRPPFDVAIIDGRAWIWRPEAGANVKPGIEILAVNGAPLAPSLQRLAQSRTGALLIARQRALVLAKLSGDPGGSVDITVQAPGAEPQKVAIKLLPPKGQLTRFGFLPPMSINIETKRLGDVGFIAFNLFMDPARLSPAFESAVKGCKAACRGFVVDLRGNPGGIGIFAMGLAGFFVTQPDQYLGTMLRRDSKLKFTVNPRAEIFTGPLAILIDSGTASTAEIMAGGLQDLGRARIFGSRSMGAALPSVIERLPNGDFFQYPVANYVSRNGKPLEGEGVTPDQVVNLTPAGLAAGDPVLDAALQWIHAQKSVLPTIRR
jgi:carboxyl-terminal processing protease